ncbi:MAG: hypothetical protein DMD90_03605 [Candidatus Rokuibacteriota bacterium]|nr:MAG: hypothetical protein DMD90_03605 [Candidatus Rokubacteria bacterium]
MRRAVLLGMLVFAGCAPTSRPAHAPIGVQDVVGVWQGWLITPRDYLAATLAIHGDGSFELSAPRTYVAGTIIGAGGALRFEASSGRGAAGWHGTITLDERGDVRLLRTARDDRLFPGRFTPDPGA